MQKVARALGSRVAVNIYFWIFFCYLYFVLNFHGRHGTYQYDPKWYYLFRTITVTLLAALLYTNNLVLVPRYLQRRRYLSYASLLLCATYVTGFGYALLFEMLDKYFPKITIHDISLFSAFRYDGTSRWFTLIEASLWVFAFAIIVFVFTIAWYMQDYRRQRKISEEAQKKQVETELNFLKSQINPHFLFNTLNNLYTLTLKKADSAPDVVSKLSTILRYLLYESNTGAVPFEKEKEIMQAYIDLELLRLSNKNNMTFSISADRACNIPPLLWVSILENTFKHGTRFISNEYFIDYSFTIEENSLSIVSKNSFKATTVKGSTETGGIGLVNLQKRLSLLYPGRHEVLTKEEGNYFITRVQIQLN